jgi:uncharacterized membrane-anchored protein
MAQVLGLGYLVAGIAVTVVIAATAVAWRLVLHPVLAFWIIYVLTRPLVPRSGTTCRSRAPTAGWV